MSVVRLTMAQALVRWLCAQKIRVDGEVVPVFPGAFGIFGHGNVTCLGEALESVCDQLPVWRGQNEQSMALAGVGFTKAKRRQQIMIATSSIGPGATNMVTAAAVAYTNRLPMLLLSGDTFASRLPDPVLQQIEQFNNPTVTANDCFKPVTRYWDRITDPAQIMQSLPQALATMLDPGECGPAFIGLPQDVQAVAYDYPAAFFEETIHKIRRPRADASDIEEAVATIAAAKKPMIICGGGVVYSHAEKLLLDVATRRNIPVATTIAGKGVVPHVYENCISVMGVTGATSANAISEETDLVIAVGTRLQDFTTGSWSVFDESVKLVSINAARYDSVKHGAIRVTSDAKEGLAAIDAALGDYAASTQWIEKARSLHKEWEAYLDERAAPTNAEDPTYAQVVAAINQISDEDDYVVSAAGGLPGELNKNWRIKGNATYDIEFAFSCMGYEVAGGWGAAMANQGTRDTVVFVGDGSYLMMNSDIYSSVLFGHKMIVIVCDNGGFAIINRLQNFKGCPSYNNLISDCHNVDAFRVDFVGHAQSMGALGEKVTSIADLKSAYGRAKDADRTYVIQVDVDQFDWTGGDAWWETGVPEVNDRAAVRQARADHEEAKQKQRRGV